MRRIQLLAVGSAAGLVLGGGIASAATKAPTSVRACVDKQATLSLMSKGRCAKGTTPLRIGVQGLTGRTGPAGAPGANGLPGTNGSNGTNGINGSNGLNGAAGPSDVYAWSGYLAASRLASPAVAVPAGDYVASWNGWLSNYAGGTAAALGCDLLVNGSGSGEVVTVPAGVTALDSFRELVHAASPFTLAVQCLGLGVVTVDSVVLTATATGTLHAAAGSNVVNVP